MPAVRLQTHIHQGTGGDAHQEEIPIDDEALITLAKKADGSLRDAESLLDQMASFSGERITTQMVRHLLGAVDQEILFRLGDIICSKDVAGGLDVAGRVIDEGLDIQEFFKGLAEHLRNLLVAKAAANTAELIDADEGGRRRYQEQAAKFSEEDILRMIRIVSDHEFNLRRSSLPKLELEMALLRLIKMDSSVTLKEVFNRLEDLGSSLDQEASLFPRKEEKKELNLFDEPEPKPDLHTETTPDIPSEGLPTLESIRDRWADILKKVKKRKISLGAFLAGGTPTRLSKEALTISFGRGNGFGIDMINKDKKIITDVLHEEFGTRLGLECVIEVNQTPVLKPDLRGKRATKSKSDVGGLFEREPIVKKIVDVFNGEIVPE
ncbi:MAG: hypothetical protein ACE5OR_00735 [bacterium]